MIGLVPPGGGGYSFFARQHVVGIACYTSFGLGPQKSMKNGICDPKLHNKYCILQYVIFSATISYMRPFNGIKPQDIVLLLKLVVLGEEKWRHVDLVSSLGLSQAEISFSLNRCRTVGFLDSAKKKVMRGALLEFLLHGLKYVFPARPGPVSRGMPTAHSAAPLAGRIISSESDIYVWPSDTGKARGQAIEPLYRSVPQAAGKDAALYELLALVDAVRAGRAREQAMAAQELERRLGGKALK